MLKIRSGFVSNSSTTSFCIMGWTFDSKQQLLNNFETDRDDIWSLIADIKDKTGFEFKSYCQDEDYCTVYFGLNISCMKDDETKAQFRQRVYDLIQQFLKKETKLEKPTFEVDGWYNG